MGELKMPRRGGSAAMLQELNAEHSPPQETLDTSNEETNVTTLQDYNKSSNEAYTQPTNGENKGGRKAVSKPRHSLVSPDGTGTHSRSLDAPVPLSPVPSSDREERLFYARQQAQEDETIVVTIRVSPKLNDYMDRYVTRINQLDAKRRYRKQDAVAEAFAAFYADHPMPPAPIEEDAL